MRAERMSPILFSRDLYGPIRTKELCGPGKSSAGMCSFLVDDVDALVADIRAES